jgi:hypothetical protein
MKKGTMKKGTTRTDVMLVTLLAILLSTCTPEATDPQGGAATINGGAAISNRLVPMVVPDVWCSAASDAGHDSTAAKDNNRPRAACGAPKQSDTHAK